MLLLGWKLGWPGHLERVLSITPHRLASVPYPHTVDPLPHPGLFMPPHTLHLWLYVIPQPLPPLPLCSFTVSHPNTVQAFCLQVVCVRADSDTSSWGPQASRELSPSVVGNSHSSTGALGEPAVPAQGPAAGAAEATANPAAYAASAAAVGPALPGRPSSAKGANGRGAAAATQQGVQGPEENSQRRRLPELAQQGSTASTVGEVVSPHAVLAPG